MRGTDVISPPSRVQSSRSHPIEIVGSGWQGQDER
jgi:hypothetical protein